MMANDRRDIKPFVDYSNKGVSPLKKMIKIFFKSDLKDLKTWAIKEVFVPGIQNFILNGLAMLFFEDEYKGGRSVKERSSLDKDRKRNYSSYFYKGSSSSKKSERVEDVVPFDEDLPDYHHMIVDDKDIAIEIVESIKNYISDYGDINLLMFYKHFKITAPDFQLDRWGWTKEHIGGFDWKRRGNYEYQIITPDVVYLKREDED